MDRVGYILLSRRSREQPDDVPFPRRGDIVFDHVRQPSATGTAGLRTCPSPSREERPSPCWAAPVPAANTLVHLLDRLFLTCRSRPPSAAWTCGISGAATCGGTLALFCREPFLFCSQTIGRLSGSCGPMRRKDAMRRAAASSPAWTSGDLASGGGMSTIVGRQGVTLSGGQNSRWPSPGC